jgi:hypothetical protein
MIMAIEPEFLERRVVRAEIVKRRPSKYTVIGYGPGRNRIHTERGADKIIIRSGATVEIEGVKEVISVETVIGHLFIRREVVPETGRVIIYITGG